MDIKDNDDFHFEDIDAFCREDISTLIDKALGLKKETKKVDIYDITNNKVTNEKKIETLEFEFNVPKDVKVEDVEIIDFDNPTEEKIEPETFDFDISDKSNIETLEFDLKNNSYTEALDFDVTDDNIEKLEFDLLDREENKNLNLEDDLEYLTMNLDDISNEVNKAFSEKVKPEPELLDFDLEEMEPIEVLDDDFFDQVINLDIPNKKQLVFKKKILISLLVIMLIALIFVIYKIIRWKLDNDSIRNQVKNIQSYVEVEDIEDSDNTVIIDDTFEQITSNVDEKYKSESLINVDFNELKNRNSDTVAWLKVNGTNIDYPVVQTSDNDYYLKHSFDKSLNEAGWVFADFRNNLVDDKNLIIYGHARLNETMFGSLKNVFKSFWYSNQDNYVIKMSTPTMNYNWLVFSTYTIPAEDYYITTHFDDNLSFYEFIKILKARSVFDYNVELNENDRILTLSTCYTDNRRVVLHAKLIKYEKRTN